jgi:hypothetical protein
VATILQRGDGRAVEHAQRLVSPFLPDVLTYELGKPANFAAGNGRTPTDAALHDHEHREQCRVGGQREQRARRAPTVPSVSTIQ